MTSEVIYLKIPLLERYRSLDMVEESMTSMASQAVTSETIKEYMVNTISVGIRPIRMKLGEDVGLEASCNINYF